MKEAIESLEDQFLAKEVRLKEVNLPLHAEDIVDEDEKSPKDKKKKDKEKLSFRKKLQKAI